MKNPFENHLWKQEAPWLEFENKQKYSGDPTFAQSFCQLWQQGFQTGYLLANENLVYFGSLGQPWPFFWSKRPKIEISKAFLFKLCICDHRLALHIQILYKWSETMPEKGKRLDYRVEWGGIFCFGAGRGISWIFWGGAGKGKGVKSKSSGEGAAKVKLSRGGALCLENLSGLLFFPGQAGAGHASLLDWQEK